MKHKLIMHAKMRHVKSTIMDIIPVRQNVLENVQSNVLVVIQIAKVNVKILRTVFVMN